MTEQQRRLRALLLAVFVVRGYPEAAAWRKVNPGSKIDDKSAAKLCRRDLDLLMRRIKENTGGRDGDVVQEPASPKQCIGVADRPCGKEIPRRRKRCQACAKELANAKRNERRSRQHQRERDEAAEQKEGERRAKLPQWVEYNGKKYLYYPETDWRQREASQPGSAPRAERRSSKQQDLPASSGKNRKAAANGASPKPRCTTCKHPDRAAIDAELLQGLSFPTVAGRYGLSVNALFRHRSRHVDSATVGDIVEPAGPGDVWREWDGTQWQEIPAPRIERLKEVRGRPNSVFKLTFSPELNGFISRRIYRRKTGR